jgi:glutathione peroxidase-family protein
MSRALLLLALLAPAACAHTAAPSAPPQVSTMSSVPALTTISGSPLPDATLQGKVVLFVNVASKCGLTPQYDGLQKLWADLKDEGLVIVGVPCNQFAGQEPGTGTEIESFCKLNYGVDFPLLAKQDVNGGDRSPLYQFLVGSPAGGGADIKWNFEKFLVGRDGAVKQRFAPTVTPDDAGLRTAIEAALAAK